MGAGASAFNGNIDYPTFCEFIQDAYGVTNEYDLTQFDIQATFDKYKDKATGLINTEFAQELVNKTDVFLTHDWGEDELGRKNHDRVAKVNLALKAKGIKTWFDSDQMVGDIDDQMVNGIDNTQAVIVFVTQRYMKKVNAANALDNCRKEFKYCCQTKTSSLMIPVVMEPRMRDVNKEWKGLLKMQLGTILYADCADDNGFDGAIDRLIGEITKRCKPLWVRKGAGGAPVAQPPVAAPAPAPVAAPAAVDVSIQS